VNGVAQRPLQSGAKTLLPIEPKKKIDTRSGPLNFHGSGL
jgi:hypothetical protein